MYDFVENLCYLEDKEIKKQEIDILRQHILSKLLSSNIISVNSSNYIAKARKK